MTNEEAIELMKKNFSDEIAKRIDKAFREGFMFGSGCGLSKREWYAGMALQGLLSNQSIVIEKSDFVVTAFRLADAMLRAGEGGK